MNFKKEDAKWAVNTNKVERAILALKKEGKEVTEEAVKELYLKFGGAIVDEPETYHGAPEALSDLDKEGLRAFALTALKKIAKKFGIDVKGLTTKEEILAKLTE